MNYRYIGMFKLLSDELILIDPAMHPLIKCFDIGSVLPLTYESVENMYRGNYVAYHVVGDDGTLVNFFIMHEGLDPNEVAQEKPAENAMAAITMSNTAVIVDKVALFDGTKSKYLLYSDAYYSAEDIIKYIPLMSYSKDIKKSLMGLATQAQLDGVPVLGYDIFTVTEGAKNPVWGGFCTLSSTHWGMDCCVRVHDEYRRGDTIYGGAVTTVERAGLLSYRVYRDSKGKGYAVCLDLFSSGDDTYYAVAEQSQKNYRIQNPYYELSSPGGIMPDNLTGNGAIRDNKGAMGVDAFYGDAVVTNMSFIRDKSESSPIFSGFLRHTERYAAMKEKEVQNDKIVALNNMHGWEELLRYKIETNTATNDEMDSYFSYLARKDNVYFSEMLDEEFLSTVVFKRNDYLGVVRTIDDVCLDDFFVRAKDCYEEVQKYLSSGQKSIRRIK